MKFLNDKTIIQLVDKQKPLKTGYLYKRGDKYNNEYKKRYFVLLPSNLLCYYHHKGDKEPIGVIFLEGHIVDLVDEAAFGGQLALVLKFPSADESCRSYFLSADTSHEIEEWMQAITRVGTDYLMITIEDLEEQLNALNLVGALENKKEIRSGTPTVPPKIRSQSELQRVNPFDIISNDSKPPIFDKKYEQILGVLCSDFDALHYKIKEYWLQFENVESSANESGSQPDLITLEPDVDDLISL